MYVKETSNPTPAGPKPGVVGESSSLLTERALQAWQSPQWWDAYHRRNCLAPEIALMVSCCCSLLDTSSRSNT